MENIPTKKYKIWAAFDLKLIRAIWKSLFWKITTKRFKFLRLFIAVNSIVTWICYLAAILRSKYSKDPSFDNKANDHFVDSCVNSLLLTEGR